MAPTIPAGGLVLVEKLSRPKAGDIVLMHIGDEPERYLKRVLAVEGEEIAWDGGAWLVNGQPLAREGRREARLDEDCAGEPVQLREEGRGARSWWASPPRGSSAPLRVPEGHIFVVGDWREGSRDSRHWGHVSLAEVDAVALLLISGGSPCAAGDFPGGPRRL